jgi:Tfp pilus assembly protein PilV
MKFKNSRSFTLLEVVIAMFILSLAVAGIFSLFATNYRYIIEAEHRLQAVKYGSMVAENLKVYVTADQGTDSTTGTPNGASVVWGGTNPTSAPLNLPNSNTVITNASNQTCTYAITNVAGATGLKQANITVTWDEP